MSTVTVRSDREVDALVAEHVMGLKVRAIRVIGLGGSIKSDVGTVDPPRKLPDGREGVAAHALPGFSTDPKACAALKRKLREEGWEIAIKLRREGHLAQPAYALLTFTATSDEKHPLYYTTPYAAADTEERALALAALRAHGIEVEHVREALGG